MTPNILFVLIDGLRADQFFGNLRTCKTPTIDSLIKKGAYFNQAFSSADGTTIALNSIFTGHFPFRTGIRAQKLLFQESNFIQILKKSGYHIYGISPNLTSLNPLREYFENQNNSIKHTYPPESLPTGLTERINQLLISKEKQEPWFCYFHIFDLHPLREGKIPKGIENFDNEKFGSSIYERTVSAIDFWFGKILEHINLDNTILILTSDHGELIPFGGIRWLDLEPEFKSAVELGKNLLPNFSQKTGGEFLSKVRSWVGKKRLAKENEKLSNYQIRSRNPYFTLSLYDESIHVPLLFVGNSVKQRIVPELVRHIDIFPTICELMNIKFDKGSIHGRSFVNLLQGKPMEEKPVFLHTSPYEKPHPTDSVGIRTSKFKYFRSSHNSKENIHLYDLRNDPFENENIAQTNEQLITRFEKMLIDLQKDNLLDYNEEEISDEEIQKISSELKRLGYM